MRHLQAVVLALASGVVGCCCLPDPAGSLPMSDARRAAEPGTPGQVVVLDVALVERPRGDHFLTTELWELGNEQGVDLESKPILEENGLRVGQIGGVLPARLLALVNSPRSCADPRRMRGDFDQPAPVQVGLLRQRLTFHAHEDGAGRSVAVEDARCLFEVIPSAEGERRLRLRFTPRVRHGKARVERRVEKDPDGPLRWSVEAREPVEEFPALSWELTVEPDEYVLIGPRLDRPGTLGCAYFLSERGSVPTQTLLVVHAARLADQTIDENLSQAPPLALQASWTARGSRR